MSDHRQLLNIAIGQLNPTVGDVAGNLDRARRARRDAAEMSSDLLVLPELFISGYPPEDLVLRPAFVSACREAVEQLALDTSDGGPAVIIGAPWAEEGQLYNSVLLLDRGAIATIRHKVELPNYGVFDEKRVFVVGPKPEPIVFHDLRIGLPVCEDLWSEKFCADLGASGVDLLISIHGSPYWRDKATQRLEVARIAASAAKCPVVYVNMVGGQDELVFDGGSFGVDAEGNHVLQFNWFDEAVESISVALDANSRATITGPERTAVPEREELDWRACTIGLRDYATKNGFSNLLIGLSGGIDSAVAAALAVDAVGAEHVRCVMLPYHFTSDASRADAAACAELLGVRYDTIPIAGSVESLEEALSQLFAGKGSDVTEENLQARTRGIILMAISNKFGELLVTTGNKSEISVGYSTLYGDMNGGFNPIKDLFKTEVYRLAAWRNAHHPVGAKGPGGVVIPEPILTKAPTAELRENQTDQDSLPPYAVLDEILEDLIEHERALGDIAAKGHDIALVERVARMVATAEYKRRQAAPGVKVTRRNFGRGRRYPITNRFVEK